MTDINSKFISLLLLCLFWFNHYYPQNYIRNDLKPNQLKKSGKHAERKKDYFSAIDYYRKYLEYKPDDYKISYRLAGMYLQTRDYNKAINQYDKAYSLNSDKNNIALFYLGRMNKTGEYYENAIENFKKFKRNNTSGKKGFDYNKQTNVFIEGCEMAMKDSSETEKTQLFHLGYGVNMAYNESSPLPAGENQLIFSSLRSDSIIHYNDSFYKDTSVFRNTFFIAEKIKGHWELKNKMGKPFVFNEFDVGNGCFSLDKNRFYFTRCRKNWKYEYICEIYYSDLQENQWSEPVRLNDNINLPRCSNTQPCIGLNPKNGQEILYFSSNRKTGKGGFDLWYSEMKKGEFVECRNLGGKINTQGDEVTPFFDVESSTLYFSSNGHPAYGELDIFKVSGNKSKWMNQPENLGKPYNSPADDLYYKFGDRPEESFLTSNRPGGIALKNPTCCDDIYTVLTDELMRFEYKVVVLSNQTNDVIDVGEIQVYLRDPENNDTTYLKTIDIPSGGIASIPVDVDQNYLLVFQTADFFIRALDIPPGNRKWNFERPDTVVLTRLTDESFVLENIYYEFDEHILTDQAELSIDSFLYRILKLNPDIRVEISSHTDAKGSNEYNMILSQKRAESVVQYLKKKGISSSRMVAKGYGKTKPIAPNTNADGSDNPQGRQLNRRTEFRVIGFEQRIRYKKIPDGKFVK